MDKRKKRAIWVIFGSIVAGLMVAMASLAYMALATPSWMPDAEPMSTEERSAAAGRAERSLLQAREYAVAAVAAETRKNAQNGGESPGRSGVDSAGGSAAGSGPGAEATGPPRAPAGVQRVEFSQAEVNALIGKWSEFRDWKQDYERFITDPTVVFRADRIIFAGRLRGYGDAVTSVHVRPAVTADGRIRVHLEQVVLGNLPVPHNMYDARFGSLANRVRRRLPDYQNLAQIDAAGMANAPAVVAAVMRLALEGLDAGVGETPLILPMLTTPGGVPVRVVGIHASLGSIAVDFVPLNVDERAGALAFLRSAPAERTGTR